MTTTKQTALDRRVGETDAIQVLGNPYDLGLVLETANRAAQVDRPSIVDRCHGERRRLV